MVSIQQTAIIVARRLGGYPNDFDGSVTAINSLSPDLELALTAGIGAEIRANPSNYTAQQQSVAAVMLGLSGAPLADASFSISDFVDAAASNGKELILGPLVNIGKSASAVANALPLIAIVFGALYLISLEKKVSA